MSKNQAAVSLGRRRWLGISSEERSRMAAETARKRWKKAGLRERQAQADALAKGRRNAATARKERAKREESDNTVILAQKLAAEKSSSEPVGT